MKTVDEIRLENLRLLVAEFGTQDRVADLANTQPVYLSQILNGAKDSKTGKVRQIGDLLARKIEAGCCKDRGWMDNQQVTHTNRNRRLTAAMAVMEAMSDDQLNLATRLLDTVAEPAKNGTEN